LSEIVIGTDSTVISSPTNLGKGNAIRRGFSYAINSHPKCELIGYIDSDGAFSKEDILQLVTRTLQISLSPSDKPLDAMLSSRVALSGRRIRRKSSRHYIGRIIATFLTRSWEGAPYDTQSGYKIFRNSKSLRSAISHEFRTSWFVDIELLTRVGALNGGRLNIWEEPLSEWQDVSGSKLSPSQFPKLIFEILIARKEVIQYLRIRGD
jgi:glycosyltransferase involved in cell wall biosynthesis